MSGSGASILTRTCAKLAGSVGHHHFIESSASLRKLGRILTMQAQ